MATENPAEYVQYIVADDQNYVSYTPYMIGILKNDQK